MELTAVFAAIALIAGLAVLLFRLTGNWLAPATIANLIWALYALGVCAFAENIGALQPALTILLLALAASSAGTVVAHASNATGTTTTPSLPKLPYRTAALVLTLMAIGEVVWILARSGFSARGLATGSVIAELTAENRNAYGYGDLTQSIPERVLITAAYAAPLFASFTWKAFRRSTDGVVAVASLLSISTISMLYGSRMGALFGGSMFVGGYLTGHIHAGGRHPRDATGGRLVVAGAMYAAIVLIGISTFTMVVRYYSAGAPPIATLLEGPFGFLVAFAYWLRESGVPLLPMTGGFYTFERAARALGFALPAVPSISVGFTESNIYTMFRGLLEDFGLIGSILMMFTWGFVSGRAFFRLRRGDSRQAGVLAASYAVAICSVAISPMAYNAPLIAILTFTGMAVAVPPAGSSETTMRSTQRR